jgi:hypothetical protein
VVHAGEIVASESIIRNAGASLLTIGASLGRTAGSWAGLDASAAIKGIGDRLSARSGVNAAPMVMNMDGAIFHGVPDQRYVNSVMDTAVRSLRNSSRTWAFNPTGQ